MRLDQAGPAAAEAATQDEFERLLHECRSQAERIGLLTQAVTTLRRRSRSLKAENLDLRAENARLREAHQRHERVKGAQLADVVLPLDPRAPGLARTVVTQCLADHVASPVLANAQLIVSEMVTNSVHHSSAPDGDDLVVRVHLWRGKCRLEVEDPGRKGAIAPKVPDRDAGAGMGLYLVQMLSERWGVIRTPTEPTRVWAQLPCARAVT